ncbi:PAS domain-containing sensor histidine kinase [Paenibacillus sp. 598K]|uniref:ATP-binding protein n=1 Tax=Paenibacillus sp. 598K TaxID=1117987 RepID=UPI000FF97AE5|nr:ATP-binding protein [Paenibacillus sp. 598K]GBF76328.1 PAS domain-containing sensor histidine kinase [Paenibacillus sp. 598K]
MSIKLKLSLFISLIVAVTLTLNISIYYISSKNEWISAAEQQATSIARQISATIEVSEQAKRQVEQAVGSSLRSAAVAALELLPDDYESISNEQLKSVSRQIGVDDITIWVQRNDDIVTVRSSEPDEIGLSSQTWGYWHTAFSELFDLQPVTVREGQRLEHFWSGPYNYATSDPSKINKWGYYYDGTTNYMINPYLNAQSLLAFEQLAGTNALLKQLIDENANVLEITGFNAEFFGKDPILRLKRGVLVHNLDVQGILFGDYTYRNETEDLQHILEASEERHIVTKTDSIGGVAVLKSFIPLNADQDYVLSITTDYESVLQLLNRQLMLHMGISAVLVLAAMGASYTISGLLLRTLNQILASVNTIAKGRFGELIHIRSRDELGELASRVNSMSTNLQQYVEQIRTSSEELQSTKQYLESFINHTSDAIHVSARDCKVIMANQAFETIYGWTAEEVLGRPLAYTPAEHEAEFAELLARVLRGKSITDHETVRLTKSGQSIDVSLTISPIRDEHDEIVAVATISRNITYRKQTEEMLRRSEKLSVVGQLAAGVAHEIRNPLTTLRGFVQIYKSTGKLDDQHLELMLAELDHINYVASELLVLSKPHLISYQVVQFEQIIASVALLLESQIGSHPVSTVIESDRPLPLVYGEPNQLKQVLVNLLKNAMDAMPDGGPIEIELSVTEQEELLVRITDHGIGMSPEQLARIGEPFYTMKESGTGLGLIVCQQIIANHQGRMHLFSQEGVGTTVEVVLPPYHS